jgi:hypothetical protein
MALRPHDSLDHPSYYDPNHKANIRAQIDVVKSLKRPIHHQLGFLGIKIGSLGAIIRVCNIKLNTNPSSIEWRMKLNETNDKIISIKNQMKPFCDQLRQFNAQIRQLTYNLDPTVDPCSC